MITRSRSLVISLFAAAIAAAPLAAQSPDRSKPPANGPVPSLKVPSIQKQALSNGLPVWVVEMHEVPVVDITVIVKSGAAADPSGKFGLASFTAAMLDEGAGARSALELADAVDLLGASLSTSSSFDASSARLHTLATKLDAALPLLADVVLHPTFPETDLNRLRTERLTSLLQIRDNPSQLASAAFSRTLYGDQHRYGTGIMGTEATNKAFTQTDLRQFYTQHYQPQNAHLLVVGDVTAAAIVPKLERAFGTWKNGAAVPKPTIATAAQPASRQIYLLDKPGAAQSQIRIGAIGVARSTPDFFVLDVLNTMLGGSFTSRLNMNLREEHGYSYGAGSSFAMRLAPGPFVAQAGVQTDKTVESLTEFFKELDRIRTPAPEEEVAKARSLEALSFPGSFETTSDMAGQLADLVVYNLPESFFNDFVPRIQAVRSADVQRAAAQYIVPNRVVVIVTGDLSKIEQPIKNADIAPVTVLDPANMLR